MINPPKLLAVFVCLALVPVGSACRSVEHGPSDRELLAELLQTYKEALAVGDAERLLGLYSEDYLSPDGMNYGQASSRLRRILPVLRLWETETLTADTVIGIDGNTATLSPVIIESGMGRRVLSITASKAADGVWKIVSTEVE